jgi:hypothetical protein
MGMLAGKTGLGVVAVFLGLALHGAAFAQSSSAQSPQAPSTAPLTDRTPGATEGESYVETDLSFVPVG